MAGGELENMYLSGPPKSRMALKWFGLIAITAIITGGTTWSYLDASWKQEKTRLKNELAIMQNQAESLKSADDLDDVHDQTFGNLLSRETGLENSTDTNNPNGIAAIDGWELYEDRENGIALQFPTTWEINTYTDAEKPTFTYQLEEIDLVKNNSGVCGNSGSSLLFAQKAALEQSKVGDSFDNIFSLTNADTRYSQVQISKGNIKYAHGINFCFGDTNEDGSVATVPILAKTFKNDKHLIFGTYIFSNKITATADQMPKIAKSLSEGNYENTDVQSIYDEFLLIMDTLAFLDE